MRCHVVVALVATLALFATSDARQLAQDALSNSNGCLGTIPKCEQGACATRNIMGVARWVCLRCLANYEPVVDASGQDNILQCVCPRGFFEADSAAQSCTRCPSNQYCPGGDKVENPTNRGSNATCGDNLVTRNTGARSQSDCLAPAGYARTSPNSGSPCATSEYAPQFNRLSKCLRCQSGLEENPATQLNAGQRASKKTVCKIPPGRFMSQGLVRICPQGFYRENYVDFDAAIGTLCLPCNPGITTDGAGKGLRRDCNVVLPGYGVDTFEDVTDPSTINPPTAEGDQGLPNATMCDIGFYSLKGQCVSCPSATVTTVKGAKSIEECVVPPGYFIPVQNQPMQQCGSGNFREGWVIYNDPKAETCTACGEGIGSEPRDLDENPKAANGSLVRATSASCFIEAGMGMIAQGRNQFVGKDCPINTYGAAGKVYGWAAAPCKPCPRNMITDNAVKVSNSEVCVNDDGFGYASEGASRCAPGFYSAKGSRKPCQQCPAGRTTADNASQQRFITECIVKGGFGVVNSTNTTDAFNPNTNVTLDELVDLPVLECPIGYYGEGGAPGSKCQQCPAGSSTKQPGSSNITACDVCVAGYGKASGSPTCDVCNYGSFHPGGDTTCTTCPSTTFYTPVDGNGDTYESFGTTLYQGSFDKESCVPLRSQLSPEAGQAYVVPGSTLLGAGSNANDLAACIESCPDNQCCMAQYDVTANKCYTMVLAPSASDEATGKQLLYKLPPSTLGSASSVVGAEDPASAVVGAKMMSSGYYAHCSITQAAESDWEAAGSNLGADARTFVTGGAQWTSNTNRADCKKLCDNSNVCWGFVYDAAQGKCSFRGGVDALATRSFFSLPTVVAGGLAGLKW